MREFPCISSIVEDARPGICHAPPGESSSDRFTTRRGLRHLPESGTRLPWDISGVVLLGTQPEETPYCGLNAALFRWRQVSESLNHDVAGDRGQLHSQL
jgi:hypothetical protein